MNFMVTFSVFKLPARGSLRRRRMLRAVRKLAAALCAGLAVLFGLETMLAQTQTKPVVIAIRDVARGRTITAADIAVDMLPARAVGSSYASTIDDVEGLIAQIDIAADDLISTRMAKDAPRAPTGTAVIEVRLSSKPDELLPGDTVQLVSAMGCSGEDCVLAREALVMAIGKSEVSSFNDNERPVSFAMQPPAAAAVMELQQAGAIIAVMR